MNAPVEEMRDIMHKTEGQAIIVADHNTENHTERAVVHVGKQVIGPRSAGTAEMVELMVFMVRTDR